MHIATMMLGGLSFILPAASRRGARSSRSPKRRECVVSKRNRRNEKSARRLRSASSFRIPWLRLLLFVAFCLLSWKATRNSHQFATVVGAVTAWNFADWAWAIGERNIKRSGFRKLAAAESADTVGGAIAFAFLVAAYVLVGWGFLYKISGEERTIGLGEEPLWFPHAAVKACGAQGMPEHFIGFSNGNVSLYEYYFGPGRKVFTDARLEVVGPELFQEYINLQAKIGKNIGADGRTTLPGWAGPSS